MAQLTPDQAVPWAEAAARILRAKAADLEHVVAVHHRVADEVGQDVSFEVNLAADIALVASILAEHIGQHDERVKRTEGTGVA